MSRRALLIGIGDHARPILEETARWYGAAGAGDALAVLWLPPRVPDGERAAPLAAAWHTLPLTLDHQAMNRLYYQPEVRKWSAANWRWWGARLAANRTYGKLAAYHHLESIARTIADLSFPLLKDNPDPIDVTLIAHLYDPFSSGALWDIAYTADKFAQGKRISVSGILMLPGVNDDPLTMADSASDAKWRRGMTYAALRELRFLNGRHSFYKTHHPDVRIDVTNHSPFQTGDCYLLGGFDNERGRALRYQTDVVEGCARFLYLRTRTPLRDLLPTSAKNQGVVSSFGFHVETEQNKALDDAEHNIIVRALIRRLLRVDERRAPSERLDDQLTPRLSDLARPERDNLETAIVNLGARAADTDGFALDDAPRAGIDLRTLDTGFARALSSLDRYRGALDAGLAARRAASVETMHPDRQMAAVLAARRAEKEATPISRASEADSVAELIDAHRALADRLIAAPVANTAALETVRLERDRAATVLRAARERFAFAHQPFGATGLALAVGVAAASLILFLLSVGLIVQAALAAGAIAFLSFALGRVYRDRARRETLAVLTTAQREVLSAERRIREGETLAAHLAALAERLTPPLNAGEALKREAGVRENAPLLRAEAIERRLRALSTSLNTVASPGETPAISEARMERMAPELVAVLWQTLSDTPAMDNEALKARIAGVAQTHGLLKVTQSEADALQTAVREANAVTAPVLKLEATVESAIRMVGLVNWSRSLLTTLDGFFSVQGVRPFWLVSEAPKVSASPRATIEVSRGLSQARYPGAMEGAGGSGARRVVSLAVYNDIPLARLANLEGMNADYVNTARTQQGERWLRVPAMLHPTRAGMAAPDILDAPPSWARDFPAAVMLLCVLIALRPTAAGDVQGLCTRLAISFDPTGDPNFSLDELCAVLQEAPDETARLFREASERFDDLARGGARERVEAAMLDALQRLLESEAPRFSELYGDWVEWTVRHARDAMDGSNPQARLLLARLAATFVIEVEQPTRGTERGA